MRRCALVAGIAAMAIALTALAGWIFGVDELRSVFSGEASMKVNTALGLLSAGGALALATRRRAPRIERGLAAAALMLGGLSLLQYVLGVDLRVDELLARDPAGAASPNPGRMAPNTALCLTLIGTAGLLLRRGRRAALAAGLIALVAGAIGLVALVGYAAGVSDFLGVGTLTQMALPTAVGILLLGVGIALSDPERGVLQVLAGDGVGSAVARRLLPVVVLVPPVFAYLCWEGQVIGLYGARVGILLFACAMIAVLAAATVVIAGILNRAEAERRTVELERRLQAQITADLAEGVCVARRSDREVVYANPRFERMLGLPVASLVGQSFDVVTRATAAGEAFERAMGAAAGRQGHRTDELEFVRPDASRFWARVTISDFAHDDHGGLSVIVLADVSDVHDTAVALARQAELFDSVLRAAADHSIIGTDLDGTIGVFNAGASRMLGYAAGEVVGRHTPALIHEPDEVAQRARELGLEPGFEVFVHAARRGEIETREWTYLRKDGTRLPVSLTVTAMHDETGELCGFIGIAQDISARRAAEKDLREQRRLLDESQAVGHVGGWQWDLETGQVLWSQEQFRLHGLDPTAGAPSVDEFLALVHPDDRDALRRSMAENVAGARSFVDEYRVLHPVEGVRTLVVDGDHIAAGAGRPARFSGTTRDVTAERQARAAQTAAEEQFRRSFDDAVIGMQIFDLDGRYTRVNAAFCAIVGHTADDLVGLSADRITHPDDVAADTAALAGLLAAESRSFQREKRFLHASGRAVWVAISVTLVRDADGRPEHFIAQVQDITERRSYEDQLQHMADHDPLTGLLNRRSFARELDQHILRVGRYGVTGAVLMLDLDNFKYYNDTQGHSAGDELIITIAHELRGTLRDSDVLARLGGDEFAVLLPGQDRAEANTVATKLLQCVRDQAMPATVGELRRVTASIGVACFEASTQVTGDEILVNADLAMYDAKEDGRDRVANYSTEQHERPRIASRMKWAEQISDALEHGGFELLAQPIVPLGRDGPPQFELLLRMRAGDGDLVPPGAFLYVAERLGMIREIDRWVTGQAIDLLAAEQRAGNDLSLEVNISGHTVGDPALLELIERRIAETGVAAERLIFEITETAAIANIARAAAFAERLSEIGCQFALDDFGAGFGSFYYLKHLPFDYLKIDGEFVRHCATNETDRLLISAIVQIARGMAKRTVAEFVGSAETVEVLKRLGVDYGQGYHLGRPAPLHKTFASQALANPPTPSAGQVPPRGADPRSPY